MQDELKKRIITSIILFILSIFSIFSNFLIFIALLILISYFIFKEISKINYRIKKKNIFFRNFLSLLYIIILFDFSAIALYKVLGPLFIFYILTICISSDIGGYVVGKKIGGKKLTKISPNKTISGSVGSFSFSILPLFIFSIFDQQEYLYSINNFLFCLEVSFACQLGDLFISYLKRKANVKDTGKILPGHGGLLDRVDGLIVSIPFVYIYTFGLTSYFKILF